MEEAERFDVLQPGPSLPPAGDEQCADAELNAAWVSRPQRTPSYAKDTQSSSRKKPRHIFRRASLCTEGLMSNGEEEFVGYPSGGVGTNKGKSCYMLNLRLKALPIVDTSEAILSRTASGCTIPSFGASRDGIDREKVPAQLSVSACSRIEFLYLRGNLLRGLWDMRLTPNLIVLDVSENELESLESIEHLQKLQHLYVNSNAVSCIDEVPVLPSLTVLSLSCNRISALDRMQHQPSLELLSLADNQILSIAGMSTCPHLVGLRLKGNPVAKSPGYRLAVLLSAAACGMLELEKLDGQPFQDMDLAQAACLAWPQRLSALYGDLWKSYEESFSFLLSLQKSTDKQRGCWLEGIGGDGTALVGSSLCFDFKWKTFDAAELEKRAGAASAHLRTVETEVARMVASVLCKGRGYVEHEESLSNALTILHRAEWKLALLPPQVRKVIGRVGGRGAGLLGTRHQLHRLLESALTAGKPPRLEMTMQWYRVDDWGNTEMIQGATDLQYTVMPHDIGFTLKAESTCHVMNWRPLDLDGMQQRGNSDVPATEASAEDEAGLRLAENCADDGTVQHESGQDEASLDVIAEQGNVIGVTCKAFAYSKRAKDPCCAAVEDLQVLGTCAHGHRLSARWSIKQSQTSNLQGGGGSNGQQPGEGMVVRWWRSEKDAKQSMLVEEGQMRPGPAVKGSSRPRTREDLLHGEYFDRYGLIFLAESAVSLEGSPTPCLKLTGECVGSWIWVEIFKIHRAGDERDHAAGAIWRMAGSRIHASSCASSDGDEDGTSQTIPGMNRKVKDVQELAQGSERHIDSQGLNTAKRTIRRRQSEKKSSPLIAGVEISGGPGFKSPTNLSRELWREWGEVDLPNSRREERAQHSGKSEDLSIAATLGARDDSEGDVFRIALDGKEAAPPLPSSVIQEMIVNSINGISSHSDSIKINPSRRPLESQEQDSSTPASVFQRKTSLNSPVVLPMKLAGIAGSRSGMSEAGSSMASPVFSPIESRHETQQRRLRLGETGAERGVSLSFGSPSLQSIHAIEHLKDQEDSSLHQADQSSLQPEPAAAQLPEQRDELQIVTCCNLMSPRSRDGVERGVWGGGGGGGGSGVGGVGHAPPPPFPNRISREGRIRGAGDAASALQGDESSLPCRRACDALLAALTCHALFLAPRDIAAEEGNVKQTGIVTSSQEFVQKHLHDDTSCEHTSVHSIPAEEDEPSVSHVEIQSRLGEIHDVGAGFVVLVGTGIYSGGTEGASRFVWTCQMADGSLTQISEGAQIRLDLHDFAGCKVKFSYLPVRVDGVQGAWTNSAWVSADASLSPAEDTIKCDFCSVSIAAGIMCGKYRHAVYCTKECQVAAWRAGHSRLCRDAGVKVDVRGADHMTSQTKDAPLNPAHLEDHKRITGGSGQGFASLEPVTGNY